MTITWFEPLLAPGTIDVPADLVDFGAQLHPSPTPRGTPRTHPNLRHGSNWIAFEADIADEVCAAIQAAAKAIRARSVTLDTGGEGA